MYQKKVFIQENIVHFYHILDKTNYIHILEMAAAFLLASFPDELRNTELDLYCDNIAQQGALRRGFSRAWDLAIVAGVFWSKASELCIDVWTERVPSAYNPSDYPTRFVDNDANSYARAVKALGFRECEPGSLSLLFASLREMRGRETPF